jgi:hypothetical protein
VTLREYPRWEKLAETWGSRWGADDKNANAQFWNGSVLLPGDRVGPESKVTWLSFKISPLIGRGLTLKLSSSASSYNLTRVQVL